MDPAVPSRKKQIITAVAVLVAITLIVVATVVATKKKSDTIASANTSSKTAADTTSPASSDSTSSTTANAATYNDGSYSANASYQSPGGTEQVAVKLTIKAGVVTDSTVTSTPTEREAREYQDMFLSSYKSQIVGKSVATIKLSRVSGSSLTSEGFNSALATIKQQAKA